MGKKMKVKRNSEGTSKQTSGRKLLKGKRPLFFITGLVVLLVIGFLISQSDDKTGKYAVLEGDLSIVKNEVTEKVTFYPFNLGGTNMEVLALKAEDGTIRTAFNTCQICYDSGRGYYTQDPDTKELVCQNCGNRFASEQVELIKGGCNPVPIMKETKTDDGTNITISKNILDENKYLFGKWTKN